MRAFEIDERDSNQKQAINVKKREENWLFFLFCTLFTFIFSFLCFEWSIFCHISSLERSNNYLKRMYVFENVCKCWSGNWVWYNGISFIRLYTIRAFLSLSNFRLCWECKIPEMNSLRLVSFLRQIDRSLFPYFYFWICSAISPFLKNLLLFFSVSI